MCLMMNPSKTRESGPNVGYSNRDLSWCMDLLQGFCRLMGPGDGERDLSFSLGTYPDCWMHLSFVLHVFYPGVEPGDSDKPSSTFSGLRCDRRSLSADDIGFFKEARISVTLRCAARRGIGTLVNHSPSTVAVILSDLSHQPINATEGHWSERGLESSSYYSGIVLFQTIVWNHIDVWKDRWDQCLDSVDCTIEMKTNGLADQGCVEELTDYSMAIQKSRAILSTIQLFTLFRKHIAQVPHSLRKIRNEWARTYEGMNSQNIDQSGKHEPAMILRNWDRVVSHVDQLHNQLLNRMRAKQEEMRTLQESASSIISLHLSRKA
ncbi:hypothetical protein F5B20DRAFT_262380 [Whalleya microplaca]|nr:hypothetical protein F5B20DRAFT_262380 [Whalleya microplaca]